MNVLAYFLAKKESFSAHAAWGALLGLVASHRLGDAFLAVLLATFLGIGWEVVTGHLSRGQWRPMVLDVVPWILGGCLAALLEEVVL